MISVTHFNITKEVCLKLIIVKMQIKASGQSNFTVNKMTDSAIGKQTSNKTVRPLGKIIWQFLSMFYMGLLIASAVSFQDTSLKDTKPACTQILTSAIFMKPKCESNPNTDVEKQQYVVYLL